MIFNFSRGKKRILIVRFLIVFLFFSFFFFFFDNWNFQDWSFPFSFPAPKRNFSVSIRKFRDIPINFPNAKLLSGELSLPRKFSYEWLQWFARNFQTKKLSSFGITNYISLLSSRSRASIYGHDQSSFIIRYFSIYLYLPSSDTSII